MLATMSLELVRSCEIEGEHLDLSQVRSSIARRLGMETAGIVPASRYVDGVVEMLLDATQHYDLPLTDERLFGWHNVLFPSGRSGLYTIEVARYRSGEMQVHPSDIDYTNDTLCLIRACRQSVQDTDGLAEPVGCAWTLGQNLPNPAAGQTRIPYRVPKEGGAVLFLYTVHGQLLLREEAWIPAGDGCWELDITALGAGIYYYTMKFDGQKQTRRLEVIR